MSRLGYTVKLSGDYPSKDVTFTLKKITLAGSPDEKTEAFYTNGTIDLAKTNTENGLWKTVGNKQNFTWFDAGDQTVNITYVDPSKPEEKPVSNKDYLFVIPQNFSEKIEDASGQQKENPDKLYVIVEYEINYKSGTPSTIPNKVYKQITPNFLQGKAYMLNLTIGRPIEFDVNLTNGVDDWGTENGINIGSDGNLWDGIE